MIARNQHINVKHVEDMDIWRNFAEAKITINTRVRERERKIDLVGSYDTEFSII